MPRHGANKKGPMSIQLINHKVYQPGDTILGMVTIKQGAKEKPVTNLALKLCCRAKVKIDKHDSNSRRIYRSRAFFLQTSEAVAVDSRNLDSEGNTCASFSVDIPAVPAKCPGSDVFDRSGDFRSNKGSPQEELPGIFYLGSSRSFWAGVKQEAYIEYWLEAHSSLVSHPATYPLFVRPRSAEKPTQDFNFLTKRYHVSLVSQRLQSEHAGTELTFRQKSRRFFTPGKVPKYTFRVMLSVPRTYQLEHPEPLPLKLWLNPILNEKSITIYNGNLAALPPVTLRTVHASLKSTCEVRAPGTLTDHEASADSKHAQRRGISTTPNRAGPGQALSIRVSHGGMSKQGSRRAATTAGEEKIYPSFATYNIALSYRLSLKLHLICGGEERELEYAGPIELLAASEEQARAREEALGEEGMRRNYDGLDVALGTAGDVIEGLGDILEAALG
ncbi:Uu.00g047690.m01.CDS01 [Anthostomella pinea]|uniref:Uu.00g047690.m01.CDS01 n=1 Tax=Anthostomella pinea TaxID=933095 RepID=A0AAI8YEI9_9PEZI|nr:Uu.00g047690.m01.CDS01 [Anthostomella pinea]